MNYVMRLFCVTQNAASLELVFVLRPIVLVDSFVSRQTYLAVCNCPVFFSCKSRYKATPAGHPQERVLASLSSVCFGQQRLGLPIRAALADQQPSLQLALSLSTDSAQTRNDIAGMPSKDPRSHRPFRGMLL